MQTLINSVSRFMRWTLIKQHAYVTVDSVRSKRR